MSDYLIAVIVGCVEGLTEFIPVSSTGHMIIVGHLLGFKGDFAALFDVFIQLGAILSIIFIYKERFRRFFTKDGWNRERGLSVWHIAVGMLPICIVGYLAHNFIKDHLFSPLTAAAYSSGQMTVLFSFTTSFGQVNLFSVITSCTVSPSRQPG